MAIAWTINMKMKFKKIQLILILIVAANLSEPAQAIHYSLIGVANISQMKETSTLGSVKGDGLLNWAGGLLLEFDIYSSIGFETGLVYYQRKFGFEDDLFSGNAIQVPLTFRFWFSDEFNFSLGLFTEIKSGDVHRTTNSVASLDNSFSSFNYGWHAAFGYDYPIFEDTGFITEVRYQSDISNRSSTSGIERKITDYQIFFGFRFGRQGSMGSLSSGSSYPTSY
jgi:hypothetical protein